MGSVQIQSVVAGVVIFVVSLGMIAPLAGGADTLYREFVPHCGFADGTTSIKLNSAPGLFIPLAATASGTTCSTTAVTTTVDSQAFRDEGGATRATGPATAGAFAASEIAGTTWNIPPVTLARFGAINKLVLSLLPLIVVVGFMATSFISLYNNQQGGGMGIANAIKGEVSMLVIALIVIFVSPIALDYIGSTSEVVSDGHLTVTGQFDSIMEILFGFMPVGLVLSIVGMIGYRGYSAVQGMRSGSVI